MAAKQPRGKTVVRKKAPSSQGRSWLRSLQRAMAITGVIFTAGVAGVFVTYLMSLPVEEIVIRGDLRHVEREDISVIIEPRVERGFLRTDIQRISDDLESLAWVARADVRRRWPGTVLVIVAEEQPIGRWGEVGYLNARGDIFYSDALPEYEQLPQLWSDQRSPVALVERYQLLQTVLMSEEMSIAGLKQDQLGQLSAFLSNGMEVQFGDRDFAVRVSRFIRLIRGDLRNQQIAKIDLRYEQGAAVLPASEQWARASAARSQGGSYGSN
jgi:cell division protein FtsQ